MMIYFRTIAAFLILLSFNSLALDSLELKVRTSFPQDAKKVSDAVEYILEPIGYELTIFNQYTPKAASIANKPITPMNKEVRTMAIYDAIQSLIGVNNAILVDHENKLISFTEVQ
ncbi:hypothetical protein [Pseudoalteromonas nigrifaciens]|uniref:hypothetical protein n=1 Tax=Pseudoalteromonas nigrifaciens TaxID=28109 RepID=UPI003FD13052